MALEEAPPFWWRRPGPQAYLLSPFAFVWGRIAAFRMGIAPASSVDVPVLCVGNLIAGGAGKTPAAIALAEAAKKRGLLPGLLSRGFGGRIVGPHQVDPNGDRADSVGDEPLLLARIALTVVAADRYAGASLLAAQGCNLIIMDDGFQNPHLAKDYSLIVVDAERGIGNGFNIPAGPLRAPLGEQLRRADALLVVGSAPGGDHVIRQAARRGKPVFQGAMVPSGPAGTWRRKRVLAFAGIADPAKLRRSLDAAGTEIVQWRAFPDHHRYSDDEARELLDTAQKLNLQLVTTSKDQVRLSGAGLYQERLARSCEVFPIRLEFDDPRAADLIIDATLRNAQERLLAKGRYPKGAPTTLEQDEAG